MTPEEYNRRLNNALREVETSLGTTMVKLGSDALATIKKRVQQTGVNAEGDKFAPYSTKKMYVGAKQMNESVARSFFGKQNNKKHDWVTLNRTYTQGPKSGKKIRLAVLEGGYKKFRELHGRQTGFTDFAFYNNMWNDIHIISSQPEHDSGLVTIGPTTDEEMKKLQGNVAKRGQILDLSESEIKELGKDFKLDIIKIMRDNGL